MAGPSFAGKLRLLLPMATKRPGEAATRVASPAWRAVDKLTRRPTSYRPTPWTDALRDLGAELGAPVADFYADDLAQDCETSIRSAVAGLSHVPFDPGINASMGLGRLCYSIVRAMRPETIVETGVGYGVSSRFILAALAENDHGALHSIDLPPLGQRADEAVGILVPEGLRSRWSLHRGSSRRLLPSLLDDLRSVDVFLHDSLHTYRNMQWELARVSPFLARPAAVIADDIEGNRAFHEFTASARPGMTAALQGHGKRGLFGIALVR